MARIDPRRHGTPVGALVLAIVIACSNPTDVCGCSPLPPSVIVVGTVTDAAGAPVAGARLLFDGIPDTMSVDPPLDDDTFTVTDDDGEFMDHAFNLRYVPGELVVRAGVIKPGTTDTLRLRLGRARFRSGGTPDTVRVAISVP